MEAQEIRYRGVFNYSENGIFLIVLERKDPIINEVNSKGLSLLGFDRKTILGKSLSEIVPDSTSRTQILEQIRDGRLPVTETVLKRNDGTTIPVLISGAGTPEGMVILNVTDIRDRKTAEDRLQHSLEEKEILLREVHHRVKNNMQVISGLIELQSAQITDPAILRLFQESYNRIKTMSLIHESLYRSNNYAHLDFSAYLSDLVSYLFTSYGRSTDDITVDIHLEKTKLPLDIAVPCGLIANELISNSLKHAFPQGRHGTISIRLTKREGNEWEFVVSDNGIGMPANLDVKTASTFGLQLIRGLADHQMRGKVEFRQGNGTTVVIRFPCGR
jgi:PAS domain S-box-containing protein